MKRKKKTQTPRPFSAYLAADGTRLTPIEDSTDFSDGVCIYVITKEEIEACDTARLIHDLRPHPNNPLFNAGPGRLTFCVIGYEEGPRDPLLIPAFRTFIRKAEQASPCWVYFAAPDTAWIRTVLAASGRQCLVSDDGNGGGEIGRSGSLDAAGLHGDARRTGAALATGSRRTRSPRRRPRSCPRQAYR